MNEMSITVLFLQELTLKNIYLLITLYTPCSALSFMIFRWIFSQTCTSYYLWAIYSVQITGKCVWVRKKKADIFTHDPRQNFPLGFCHYPPQAEGMWFSSTAVFFWKSIFLLSRRGGGGNKGSLRSTKVP